MPDIFVQKVGSEFVVQVNDEGIPRLKINQLYQKMLNNSKFGDEESKNYFQEKNEKCLLAFEVYSKSSKNNS